jgi:glycosyltransferase involved in cell wall biosynthesis
VRHVDGVFCIPSTSNKLFKTYSKNNRVVREIYNVPVLESNIDKDLYKDLKDRYAKRKILVYAGAIINEKGVINIVKAINNVRIQHRDVKLILIGSAIGDDTEIVRQYIEKNNIEEYVDIIGFQPYSKLYTYYCIADIGIGLIEKRIASKFTKGGSRKLMEYMKASLALLVTNDGDIGTIVKEEECGILVDIWDETALTNKINWLLEHPIETNKMGERGKLAIHQKYNWNLESAKFLKVYNSL